MVVRHLCCTDHQLGFLVWCPSPTCNHERYTTISLLSLHRKGRLAGYSWGIHRIFLSPHSHSSIGYMKKKPFLVRPMDHILKLKPHRAKHHARPNRWCRSDNMGRVISLLDFRHTEFLIMHERHGSRAWYLDIILNRQTCMITYFQWYTTC